jgi:hypothetical protein
MRLKISSNGFQTGIYADLNLLALVVMGYDLAGSRGLHAQCFFTWSTLCGCMVPLQDPTHSIGYARDDL